jgi:predicted RND superfamily exporter protein
MMAPMNDCTFRVVPVSLSTSQRDPAGHIAEQSRQHGTSALNTAIAAAGARMRPVLMTSAAMIAGMIPMALALGEGADATAPLGRAVIGGLAAATLATLIVLPSVYSLFQQSARVSSPSLDPDDPDSTHWVALERQ